jgi:hypothetical protein
MQKSFEEFQKYFENTFGNPIGVEGSVNSNHCGWEFGKIFITHSISDRFGPEETLTIENFGI